MPKLLLIQAGKDVELGTALIERGDPDGTSGREGGPASNAARVSQELQGAWLNLSMRDLGGKEVTFDLHDNKGHSVEVTLPLSPALSAEKSQTEHALKSKDSLNFFAALSAEIGSAARPRRPMSLDALQEARRSRRATQRSPWSRAEAVSSLQREADRAILILKGILQLAAGDSQSSMSRIRLQSVLRRTVSDHKSHYPERSIELVQRSTHLALGLPQRLDLALSLFLSNAEEYSQPNESFEVDCFDGNRTCSIALLDNSSGEYRERSLGMWDLFEAAQDSPDQLASGSGISLSVGRQLVESMHGEVWYGHRRQGGDAFVVDLPRARSSLKWSNVVTLSQKRVERHSRERFGSLPRQKRSHVMNP